MSRLEKFRIHLANAETHFPSPKGGTGLASVVRYTSYWLLRLVAGSPRSIAVRASIVCVKSDRIGAHLRMYLMIGIGRIRSILGH